MYGPAGVWPRVSERRARKGSKVVAIPDTDARVWARRLLEHELAGGNVSIYHQLDWLQSHRPGRHHLLAAAGDDGSCAGLCAVTLSSTRIMPGHRMMRVERFQGGLSASAERALLGHLIAMTQRTPRLLQAQVRLLHQDAERRKEWGQQLAASGFARSDRPRYYRKTVVVDLDADDAVIFAGLHRTARRHIRAVGKNPVQIKAITDPILAGRMEALLKETHARTGGKFATEPMAELIALTQRYPSRVRVLGLFRTDIEGADALLAFAVGYMHGDHAEYATAASTRHTKLKLPLGYGLAWSLMQWAKQHGAKRFDFGGVTSGSHGDASDALGGISDFKRYFSSNAFVIADEWMLQPHPLRAQFAAAIRHLLARSR